MLDLGTGTGTDRRGRGTGRGAAGAVVRLLVAVLVAGTSLRATLLDDEDDDNDWERSAVVADLRERSAGTAVAPAAGVVSDAVIAVVRIMDAPDDSGSTAAPPLPLLASSSLFLLSSVSGADSVSFRISDTRS